MNFVMFIQSFLLFYFFILHINHSSPSHPTPAPPPSTPPKGYGFPWIALGKEIR